jgi:WD40 repeat protein
MLLFFLVGIYGDMNGELIAILHGHVGGITHIQFSSDGNRLYSGARKVIRIDLEKLKV